MFQKAQIKLTFFYSILFLLLFWGFSFGLYEWMNRSFGEGYISQVQQRQEEIDTDGVDKNTKVVTIAGDVALDQLLNILIVLNCGLFFVIPVASWFLVKKTLLPVREAHERQKQFVSDASHEMRTPLSIISGEIEVSLNRERSVTDYKKTLQSTKEETDRLSKLVDNLLFLARDDQMKQELQSESVDITDVVSEVVQALYPKNSKKSISVTLMTEQVTAPVVKGNITLLRQLFFNLLDNAIINTPKNGKVVIKLSERDNTVVIAIKDSGIGIPKEEQKKILNRFYRVDPSRSKTKGYGLGLAIVSSIIARHKGELHILSAVKKGSIFTVILPKA